MINNTFQRHLPSVNPDNISKFKSIVDAASKLAVIMHVNPDGDAMGSGMAVAEVLMQMGKTVNVVSPSKVSSYLHWMHRSGLLCDFAADEQKAATAIAVSDLIICVDFNSLSRVDKMSHLLENSSAKKVMIDHHPYPDGGFDAVFSETSVSSTCELALNVLLACDYASYITKEVAEFLYAGIITDTGSLSHNSSSYLTYMAVAELLKLGADKDFVHDHLFFTNSETRLRLMGHCLNEKMVVLPEYRTAYITLSLADQTKFNYKQGDSEGFVNYPLSIDGVCFCAFFTETTDLVKVSFRSKGKFAANEFSSANFNGGGHLNAAGGRTKECLGDAVERFLSLLPAYKEKLNED